MIFPYNHAPIDSNHKVEPRLNGELEIGVAEDLEPKCAMILFGRRGIPVEAGYKSVEGVEHCVYSRDSNIWC